MDTAVAIAEAYRWQRGLGNKLIQETNARFVVNPSHPDVWDANHIDSVTADTDQAIDSVLSTMEVHLDHCGWRVVHTDAFTPERFLARLALDGYEESPAVIQMQLKGDVSATPSKVLKLIETDEDWLVLGQLVRKDHEEGARTGSSILSSDVTEGIVASYRAKEGPYRFHLAQVDGEYVAYGAYASAPNGVGMIEDLYTLPSYRRKGIASGMIAAFAKQLHSEGCKTIFLGALMGREARHLYTKIGFRPVMLSRCWFKQTD